MVAVEKVMMPRESCHTALFSSLPILEQDMRITYFYNLSYYLSSLQDAIFLFGFFFGGEDIWKVASDCEKKQVTFVNNFFLIRLFKHCSIFLMFF